MSTQAGFFLFVFLLLFLAAAFAVTLWARSTGRSAVARLALWGSGIGVLTYAVGLLGAGLLSRTTVLSAAEEKYFCELDCHLAYQVVAVGAVAGYAGSWEVLLQTRFDETTISARRPGEAPTWPAPRRVAIIGSDGRSYPLQASTTSHGSTALTEPLVPGARYVTRLECVLPPGIVPQQLKLQDDLFLTQLFIGNERSPFHAPVLLALPQPAAAS